MILKTEKMKCLSYNVVIRLLTDNSDNLCQQVYSSHYLFLFLKPLPQFALYQAFCISFL